MQTDDVIRRNDGRVFRVAFVNTKARIPVFTAESADGKCSDWGGPIAAAIRSTASGGESP